MKNKLNLDNGVKIVLIILGIYVAIVLIVFLPSYLSKKNRSLFLMTSRYKIKYENGKWKNIINGDDYKLKKFDIYQNGNFFGNYKVLFSTRFTLIDDNESVIPYSGYLFAKSGSIKVKLYNYNFNEETDIDDDEIIKQALKQTKIDTAAYYRINQKVTLDKDKSEVIYFVDNIENPNENSLDGITEPVDNLSGKNFSLLVLYKNNKVYIIDKIITDESDFKSFEMLNIIDIDEDNKLELIYNIGERYNSFSDCVKLYNLENEKEIHNFCE